MRRVEHGETPQPLEEGAQRPVRLPPEPCLGRARSRRVGALDHARDPGLRRLPFGEQRPDDHRLDDPHDLVAVGVVRPELRALVRIEPALEQRPQDRRIDFRPVERGRPERRLDPFPVERQRGVVVEQSTVEPRHRFEPDTPARGHRAEQVARQVGKFLRPSARMLQHPGEHAAGQQAHVLGEHAEHQTVDEVRHRLRIVAPVAEALRKLGEGRRRAFRHRLPRLARPQPLRLRNRPLELVAGRTVREIVERKLVQLAHAVRPVGADPELRHVRDDQERRVLQGKRVLPQLVERRVEVRALALVLPCEAAALPHVGPAVTAGVLPRAALEAVPLACRVGVRRRRFAEHLAEVVEVRLRRRALLQLRRPPLGDELARRHRADHEYEESDRQRRQVVCEDDDAASFIEARLPGRGVHSPCGGIVCIASPLTSGVRLPALRAGPCLHRAVDRGTIGSLKRRDGSGPLPARPVNRKRCAAHKVIPTSFGSGLVTPERRSLPARACAPLSALAGTFDAVRRLIPPGKTRMLWSIHAGLRVKSLFEPWGYPLPDTPGDRPPRHPVVLL